MKKILFSALILIPTFCAPQDYAGMLNAILASDYQAFLRAKNNEQIPIDKQYNLLDSAQSMVALRQKMVTRHSFQAALCTELFSSLGAFCLSSFGLAIMGGVIEECVIKKQFADRHAFALLLSMGIITTSAYFGFTYMIRAYKKPKLLLDEALRIKDELYCVQ
jgi:hypothetical protein